MSTFKGKVVVVTGGGSGIGQTTALTFAKKGASVVVVDISEKNGLDTVQQIKNINGEAFFVLADVSIPEDVERAVVKTVEKYARLDYACNCAGRGGVQNTVADYDIDIWNKVIAVDLTGTFLCMKYELKQMVKQGDGGAIVNIASVKGLVGDAKSSPYTSAKHGVIGLTKEAAIEYGKTGIRINAVCPGWIGTPLVMNYVGTEESPIYQKAASLHPMGRLGKPSEVANTVVWLCSDEASFITGSAVVVDGGYIAW
ncbi:MAG: SDR family oxidoreductase [Chloroflexi bacterium]|nr:SDR family oxidoreductase [Chloroflexota bacterium]